MNIRKCICCSTQTAPLSIKDQFLSHPLQYCSNCHHIQLLELPHQQKIKKYYEQEYSKDRSSYIGEYYFNIMKNRAISQLNFINHFFELHRRKKVFDIGCGPGHYSIALSKAGAKRVTGIDFADEMINIAKQRSKEENVFHKCEFQIADIFGFEISEKFDYSILMGFMDYIADPAELIKKVITLTDDKIFFSFPKEGGLLAAQRKLRYRKRCPLYLYRKNDLIGLFSDFTPLKYQIEEISRDFYVTLFLKDE